ncbi:hypothetical protein [Streptobacillus moniliformis]|uniref:hypothetical protein n=1 Tax=Streptobacillus moniliformis TaxID=34105 RepID=UPI0007E45908|nr:hypothetical protein [Streptobacillus moniliformis]
MKNLKIKKVYSKEKNGKIVWIFSKPILLLSNKLSKDESKWLYFYSIIYLSKNNLKKDIFINLFLNKQTFKYHLEVYKQFKFFNIEVYSTQLIELIKKLKESE